MTDQNESTNKIGGWLILVGIGIVLSPVKIGALVWTVFSPIFTDGTWGMMTTSGTEFYHYLWGPIIISEIVINLLFVLAWIYAGYLFFTKKKLLPVVYIGLISLSFIFVFIDAFAIKLVMPEEPVFDAETTKEVIRAFVACAIWIPYMLMSKRVKSTFIN